MQAENAYNDLEVTNWNQMQDDLYVIFQKIYTLYFRKLNLYFIKLNLYANFRKVNAGGECISYDDLEVTNWKSNARWFSMKCNKHNYNVGCNIPTEIKCKMIYMLYFSFVTKRLQKITNWNQMQDDAMQWNWM